MRKKNAFLAAAVIGALPLLMLMQQRLMPRNNPAAPPHLMLRQDQKLLWATEDGLIYNRFYARNVAYAAGFYAARGEHVKAQKWFQLGAAEFRYPSVMLLYGDYHLYSRKYHLLIKNRKRTRHTHTHRTAVCIGSATKLIFTSAEYFCSCI